WRAVAAFFPSPEGRENPSQLRHPGTGFRAARACYAARTSAQESCMQFVVTLSRLLLAALALGLPGARGIAAEPAPADAERRCPGLIADLPNVQLVKFERIALADGEVRLTYVGH